MRNGTGFQRINTLFLYYEELISNVTSPLILAPIQQYLQPTCATAKTSSFRLPDHPIGSLPDVMEIGVSGANVKILSLHRLQAGLGSRRPISSPGRDGCSSPGGAATRDRGSGRRRAAARFRHRFCPQISRLRAVSGGRGPPICLQIKDRVIGSQRLPLYGALCCQWKRSRSRPSCGCEHLNGARARTSPVQQPGPVAPHCRTKIQGAGLDPNPEGGDW